MELLLPRGKARLWASVLLRKGHPEGCFPQPSSPKSSLQLEDSQSSSLLQGMARAQKTPAQGQMLPHQAAASTHLALEGARINAKTNPDWGCFTQSTEWKLSSLTVPFFPKKLVLLAVAHKENWLYSGATFSKPTCGLSIFAPLSGAERRRELPSDLQLCANLPPLKRKSNGHRLTRCFMLENWNFVFPVLFQGWFLYTQCTYPAKPELCLARAELKGRQALVFASRFWTLATQRLCVKCNIKPLTIFIPTSDMSYSLGIFSHWMQDDSFSS